MTDRDESEPRPNDESWDRPIDQTESIRGDALSNRDRLIAQFLLLHRFVVHEDLAAAEQELADQDNGSLLDLLAEQGHITSELQLHVDGIASELLSRSESAVESTLEIGDTAPFPLPTVGPKRPEGKFGDYEIIEEIAKGGMGVVYKARQTKLNRTVALKMIRSGELADRTQIERFYAEAAAAARLDHPGIVPVYEVGQLDGQHFYSMAYVEGRSLHEQVKQDGPMAPEDAALTMRDAAQAVQAAHGKGVIHRDIKPHNILADHQRRPKITDFGLAKIQQSPSELTATGQVLGTPAYMSPEQAEGELDQIGKASDVYSLGATLYFLLVGRPPFETASVVDTIRQVIENEPVAPRRLNPAIPRDLETICLKCLRKEQSARYATAEGLADDLQRWLEGVPIKARRISRAERAWKWCKRKPVVAGLTAAIVLVVIAGCLVFWERQQATRAAGLVDALATAEPQQVPGIIEQLNGLEYWSTHRLRHMLTEDQETVAAERARRHARYALAAVDATVAAQLKSDLLNARLQDVGNIRDALGRTGATNHLELWSLFRDPVTDASTRFRVGLALAGLAPQNVEWLETDHRFLVDQLVETNAVYQPLLWPLLRPIEKMLLVHLEEIFEDQASSPNERLSAANALVYFAPDDATRLAQLCAKADPAQFEIVYETYAAVATDVTNGQLRAIAGQRPSPDLSVAERIDLGRERAGAAITLLRQGENEPVFEALRYEDDPEAISQFAHGCRLRDARPESLIRCIELADANRGPLGPRRRKVDDSVMYGLLLALGEFDVAELPARREELIARLVDIYAQDPSSAVHGATGWLLRRWGYNDAVNGVDRTVKENDVTGHREWFVREIEATPAGATGLLGNKVKLYFTFVVFPAGEFIMGSPEDEPHHQRDEKIFRITLTRPSAVCDRELTWRQWMTMEGTIRRDQFLDLFGKPIQPEEPVFGVNWFEVVGYCRWLSKQAGVEEEDQCYGDPASLPKDSEGNPLEWPLNLDGRGFRLPTEAEWERVCRSGTRTSFSFGNDHSLAGHYAWIGENSADWLRPVAQKRPNPRGLFDMHGNLYEWCNDRYGLFEGGADPLGTDEGTSWVNRGGNWINTPDFCRSASRNSLSRQFRNNSTGFRLFFVPAPTTLPGEGATTQSESALPDQRIGVER